MVFLTFAFIFTLPKNRAIVMLEDVLHNLQAAHAQERDNGLSTQLLDRERLLQHDGRVSGDSV